MMGFLRAGLVASAAILGLAAPALANLTILDPIITFEEGERNKTVRVMNAGNAPMQVKVSLVNLRRDAAGNFAEAGTPQPGELFADKMIRFSPSQFTLAPGAQQAIRVATQITAEAGSGEFKTYLRVEEVGIGQVGSSDGVQIGVGFIHQLPITIKKR